MNYIAQHKDYTLAIMKDQFPPNPRKHFSNLTTLHLWEGNNVSGDVNRFKHAHELLQQMVFRSCSPTKVVNDVQNGKFPYLKIIEEDGFNLQSLDPIGKRWDTLLRSNKSSAESLLIFIIDELAEEELLQYAKEVAVIQPLYLTDAWDSTIYTTPFMGQYDGSECGFALILHKEIQATFGDVNEETISKACEIIEKEVYFYDKYLSCDSYEYKLYEAGEEVCSNYYIYGDLDEICEFISGDVGTELESEVNSLLEQLQEVSNEELHNCFATLEGEMEEER